MFLVRTVFLTLSLLFATSAATAQTNSDIRPHDSRLKTDLLVVVAHPDDETMVSPFLAQASLDRGKRIAVVFVTRGERGSNGFASERAGALALVREMEAREALADLGIKSVWFLDGKDTPSQNVLDSLAAWGHGGTLERLVRLVRLLRPEVVLTMLPASLIGQNHADHQAAGVIATEAFDLAGDRTAFPAQLSGLNRVFEAGLENLLPWRPKRLYFFDDTGASGRFQGHGPLFAPSESSSSQSKPLWQIALQSKARHRTQFPALATEMAGLAGEQDTRMRSPEAHWPEKQFLILGKTRIATEPGADIFADLDAPGGGEAVPVTPQASKPADAAQTLPRLELGGPWAFLKLFRSRHGLRPVPGLDEPEIALRSGRPFELPLIYSSDGRSGPVTLSVEMPAGWRLVRPNVPLTLPAEPQVLLTIGLEPPALTREQLRSAQAEDLVVTARSAAGTTTEVRLRVLLAPSALPF